MNSENKFNSYVIAITTGLMFLLWVITSEVMIKYKFMAVILGSIISLGTYRTVYIILNGLFVKCKCLRKHILAASYVEGVWIGFFIGTDDKVRYYIENFEQDLNSLIIRGNSFDDCGKFHGSWTSDTTYINLKKGKLTYYYEADIIRNTFINPGLASFEFIRESSNQPPKSMIGFSSDLFNPKKLKSYEERIEEKIDLSPDEILKRAKEIYERNKNFI